MNLPIVLGTYLLFFEPSYFSMNLPTDLHNTYCSKNLLIVLGTYLQFYEPTYCFMNLLTTLLNLFPVLR